MGKFREIKKKLVFFNIISLFISFYFILFYFICLFNGVYLTEIDLIDSLWDGEAIE